MARSRLGQLAPRRTVYQGRLSYPSVYVPYAYNVGFQRRQGTTPGQPYQMNIDPKQVEEAIYEDLPSEVKQEEAVAGANPQKVIKLRSGLEVPQYIVQRDIERKEAEKIAKTRAAMPKEAPSFLHRIGNFASKKPLQASLLALLAGGVVGNIYAGSK